VTNIRDGNRHAVERKHPWVGFLAQSEKRKAVGDRGMVAQLEIGNLPRVKTLSGDLDRQLVGEVSILQQPQYEKILDTVAFFKNAPSSMKTHSLGRKKRENLRGRPPSSLQTKN